MKQKVYAVYDKKARAYGQPMYFSNDAVAIRAIKANMVRDDDPFRMFPEDYRLVLLGVFDSETGFELSMHIHDKPEEPDEDFHDSELYNHMEFTEIKSTLGD